MIIVLNCPNCKKSYEIDGALAGKKSRCKQCGEVFRIPVPTARIIEPTSSPASAPAPQPEWIATPVAELLDGDPVDRPSRPPARAAAPPPRNAPMPPPAASARSAPAPSEFDDLPPPRRMRHEAARKSSWSRSADSELGATAFGWFMLLQILFLVGTYIYLTQFETDHLRVRQIYGIGSAISMILAGLLSFWGLCWLLSFAFNEDVMRGVFCLVVPFYAFVFGASRWEERRGAVGLLLTSPLVVALNLALGWLIAFTNGYRVEPHGPRPGAEAPNLANNKPPPGGAAVPNPAPAAPVSVSKSTRKADAEQVRLAERVIRQRLPLLKEITAKLAKIHNVASANQVGRELQFRGMFPRVQIRRPRNLDVGPNEIVALKHKVGQEIRSAFTDFKNQALRVQSIPGVGEGIDAKDLAEIDEIIDHWAIKPGEEAMPELVEPPPRSNRLAGPGPRAGFPPGAPGPPAGFPPGAFPNNQPPPIAADIVEQMERDYQRLHQQFGDRTAAILVTGFPAGSDPSSMRDVTEAISKRIKELAPEATTSRAVTIGDRFETAVAPVNNIQGLALGIDFGAVTIKGPRIEVKLDAKWAANVPRRPADSKPGPSTASTSAPGRPAEPEIPAGADAITRSMIELKSSDFFKRKQAIERLGRSTPDGRVDQVVGTLAPLLEDDNVFLATESAKALGSWRSPEAMTALIGRMQDNRHFVRSESIKALGKYREPRAAEAIVTVLKEDGFATEDALKSMGELAEPALIPVLRSPDAGLRRHACRILAQVGGQKTLVEMQSLPADPDGLVRMAAKDAWNQIVARVGPPPKPVRGKTTTPKGR